MYALTCALTARPTVMGWDLISGLLHQFHSKGIEEGEEPPPAGEASLVAANEFEEALAPGLLAPPLHFTAYFDNRRDAEHALRAIEPHLESLKPIFDIHEVEDKNYAELWKENFHPIHVPPCWLVRASWHSTTEAKSGELELIIEPGMAFGTGTHETTRGCLELLSEACHAGKLGTSSNVLDFGCGSGILAIALKKLGVGMVYGLDIDPLAIEATQQNAARNNVEIIFPSPQTTALPQQLDGIVANILKNTLLEFEPFFASRLKPQGFLVLSGLLAEHEQAVLDHYNAAAGWTLERRLTENNWVSVKLRKN